MPVKCVQQHGKIFFYPAAVARVTLFLFQGWHSGQPERSPRDNDYLQHSLTKMFNDSTPNTEPRCSACIVPLGAYEPFSGAQKLESTAFM